MQKRKNGVESDVGEICPFNTEAEGVRQGAKISYLFLKSYLKETLHPSGLNVFIGITRLMDSVTLVF